jgi:two-component system sensor histidine kinase UhpB
LYVNGGGNRNVGTMGYVQVRMSPTAMLHRQQGRFLIELVVASAGLLACALLAFKMTKGFDTSLRQSMQALREADAEKRRLIGRVNTAVEDERKAIALEIHDELNATLIAVRLESQQIAQLAGQAGQDEAIRSKAHAITKLALGLYNSGRSLVRRLRPEVLDMLGLEGAIEEMVRQYDSNHPDCCFTLRTTGDFGGLDSGVAISVYRLVQEALSNVVKHSRATSAVVELVREGDSLRLLVSDNGIGFDPVSVAAGIGIVGMKERVHALDGSFTMDSSRGTRITITLATGS